MVDWEREDQQGPEFEVIFRGDALEPQASVAPEGDVTFVILNSSDSPHDFALVGLPEGSHRRLEMNAPLDEEHIAVVGRVMGIEPGTAETVTFPLERGEYAMISNTPGQLLGASLFELTVQPVEGEGSRLDREVGSRHE